MLIIWETAAGTRKLQHVGPCILACSKHRCRELNLRLGLEPELSFEILEKSLVLCMVASYRHS